MTKYGHSTTSEEVAQAFSKEIAGKTVLVTGPTLGGIGAQFALAIAPHKPKLIILAGRSAAKAEKAAEAIKAIAPEVETRVLQFDTSSLKSARAAAEQVNSWGEPIDVLMNNSGIAAVPFAITEEGFESHFATNHLGHFLFTNLILPRILSPSSSAEAEFPAKRVVNVSSAAHGIQGVRFEDLTFFNGMGYNKWLAYGQSKTANVLFSKALAERFGARGLVSLSLHPGEIVTNMIVAAQTNTDVLNDYDIKTMGWTRAADGKIVMGEREKTVSQGAASLVAAAFNPRFAASNGGYVADSELHPEQVVETARSPADPERLWKLSEKLVGEEFAHAEGDEKAQL